jgi:hypothetical protein
MRHDISDKLVHLTKGTGEDAKQHRTEAFKTLYKILKDGALIGGTGYIKGKQKCVCFSEAPISALSQILSSKDSGVFKYQPYGVLVSKDWIYAQGGRPAIYGPDADYVKLPSDMQYRHVRFELACSIPIDHTWEREWRVRTDKLTITPADVTVVVPTRDVVDALREHGQDKWHYIALSDLGVSISSL